jgi:hypothetical protein
MGLLETSASWYSGGADERRGRVVTLTRFAMSAQSQRAVSRVSRLVTRGFTEFEAFGA